MNYIPMFLRITVVLLCVQFQWVFSDNQIVPGNMGTSDPAPMVDNGTLYLYTTVDSIGAGDLSIYKITCHSTTDLYHWKDEGVVLEEKNISWAAKTGNLWAPHCIRLGGKYHLYFPAHDGSTHRMGHAVANTPAGPFIADKSFMSGCGVDAIDPFAVLDTGVGASGKAYLAWNQVGATPNQVYIAELNSSYDNVTGTVKQIQDGLGSPTRYKEGIWMVKQNNTWYCIIADWTGAVESITYSTANSITGPYTKRGTILNENTNSATIHCGVVNFLNKWVIIYHIGGNEFGGSINNEKRVAGIEYISFNTASSPWSISEVPKTYRGVGIPHSYDTIQIDRYSPSGIKDAAVSVLDASEPRGWMVSGIKNNGYVKYNDVDFTSTDKTAGDILMRVASVSAGGSVELRLDSPTGTLIGTISVPSTGGLTKWQTIQVALNSDGLATTGIKNLVAVFKTTAANQYNVNWVKIGKQSSTIIQSGNLKSSSANMPVHMSRISPNIFKLSTSDLSDIQSVRIMMLNGREVEIAAMSKRSDNSVFINLKNNAVYGPFILSISGHRSRSDLKWIVQD